ncbi:MAG: hypothetical protein ACOY45_11110 [Pseudomonadota bacterium]
MRFRYPSPAAPRRTACATGWMLAALAAAMVLVVARPAAQGWGLWQMARMAPPDIGLGLFGVLLAGLAGMTAWRIAVLSAAPYAPGRVAAHLTAPLVAAATLSAGTLIPALCAALVASALAAGERREHRVVALLAQCSALAAAGGVADTPAGGGVLTILTVGIAAFSVVRAPRAAANDNPSMERSANGFVADPNGMLC